MYFRTIESYTPFISPHSQSLHTELHFQFIRFAAAILQCASVCFHTEHWISAFWKVRFKKRSNIEQKDIITTMHCLAFPSALFGAPFHIDNRTVADCGFWLEYTSKTPLEVVADLPHRMRLFWLRCQIMRLRSVHIKPHYSQNAFDSALLAWYERGISKLGCMSTCSIIVNTVAQYREYVMWATFNDFMSEYLYVYSIAKLILTLSCDVQLIFGIMLCTCSL